MNIERSFRGKFGSLEYFVEAYLHQDWSIDGGSVAEIMKNRKELVSMAPKIRRDAEALLGEGLAEGELEDLFENTWKSGYEPDVDEGETWAGVLQEIIEASLAIDPEEKG